MTTDDWKEFLSPAPVGLVVVADAAYVNVSPGTWIQKVSYDPPVLMLSRKLGSDADLLLARQTRKEFVVSLPPAGYEEDVLLCSQRIPYGQSELDLPGVRFRVAERIDDLVFLEPMVSHAVCRLIDMAGVTTSSHRVYFAEVLDVRLIDRAPESVMLHYKTKTFARVGPLVPCRGW